MRYEFTLTGISSLIVHADNIPAADDLMKWRKDPSNKSVSVAGDDRTPPWTWITYLYSDGKSLCMLSDAIMVALRFAGSKMTMKKQESFKSATQSGIIILDEFLPILVNNEPILKSTIVALKNLTFEKQAAAVEELGFKIDVRRATVARSKNIRCRPRFDAWSLNGVLDVSEQAITTAVLEQLFHIAGNRAGIGDWRPSAPKPGPFGRFETKLDPID